MPAQMMAVYLIPQVESNRISREAAKERSPRRKSWVDADNN